ncbi:MAG: CIA30 family protein [Verrucomicrobia bacterium]|nr:CIA30 family protein [Verrucomicrobiota bacterium]
MKPHSTPRSWILHVGMAALLTQLPLFAAQQDLATFAAADSLKLWTSVNDGVMGGVSKGGFKRTEQGTLVFSGDISLENNGGFASIRTQERKLDLSGMSAILVKARGDGRTYWVELRVTGQMGASSYRAFLPTTAGEWRESRIPLTDFKLQAFGRVLPFKAINTAAVTSVGFTLADKKAGPFSLEIESVKATGDEAAPASAVTKSGKTLVDVATAAGGFKTLLAAATAADLVGVLSGEGPLTVLAPTDEAFAKLPAGTVDNLLKPENRGQLVAILKNHVIAGQVTLAKALELREGTTLQGSKVAVRFEDGRVRIGSATLVTADIQASNGIIHVIDQVLIPATTEAAAPSPAGLIELAIKRGVPFFNQGEAAACAALYEVTCEALQVTGAQRGACRVVGPRAGLDPAQGVGPRLGPPEKMMTERQYCGKGRWAVAGDHPPPQCYALRSGAISPSALPAANHKEITNKQENHACAGDFQIQRPMTAISGCHISAACRVCSIPRADLRFLAFVAAWFSLSLRRLGPVLT